jgi:predicted amidophosphoribosyltransferase
MYKRDRFDAGLVVERCAEILAVEARVQEIDTLLDGSAHVRPVCAACGSPLLLGARFCPSCGRPVDGRPRESPPSAGEHA